MRCSLLHPVLEHRQSASSRISLHPHVEDGDRTSARLPLAGAVPTLCAMNRRQILISGASIAGLACAYWLRSYGFAVTIVEIAPATRPGGQAVDLRGAGRTVIERMGMLDDARCIGLDQAGISWVDQQGRTRAAIGSDDFDGEGFISEIEILRGDLVDLLHRRLDDEVEYLFNDSIMRLA